MANTLPPTSPLMIIEYDPATLPPFYEEAEASQPPGYEFPPTYKTAISARDGEPIVIGHRAYARPSDIQLSPLEVSLLKEGVRLPFVVALSKAERVGGTGWRASVKWLACRYVARTHCVELCKEDVDDYGRWIGSRGQGSGESACVALCKWLRRKRRMLRERHVMLVWVSAYEEEGTEGEENEEEAVVVEV